MFYGAAFDALPVPLQTGWVAHEVLYVALRHTQRTGELQRVLGDVDERLFNTCADAIVNSTLAHLAWLQLPCDAVQFDRLLQLALGVWQPVEKSLLEWTSSDCTARSTTVAPRAPTTGARAWRRHAPAAPGPAAQATAVPPRPLRDASTARARRPCARTPATVRTRCCVR